MYGVSVDEPAHHTGGSLGTFRRDVRKISGLPPEKWLIRRRLEAARERRREGDATVMEVAAEVGFRNTSHFSTAFKRQFGVAPTSVRNSGPLPKRDMSCCTMHF